MNQKLFLRCSLCGKTLVERLPNSLFRFKFGRVFEGSSDVIVDMKIHGSIKMRCIRRSCRKENSEHWNVFNFFPTKDDFDKG